ncbi:MAG: AAA family ATPase [Myxococcota bacterium]
MLTKLYIDGFRLWTDATIRFQRGLPTVLIGPNGSGKTTILEVMAFLSAAASDGLRAAVYDARGGPSEFFAAGKSRMQLSAWLDSRPGLPTEADRGPVRYELTLMRDGPFARVEKETISVYKRGLEQPPLYVVEREQSRCRLRNVSTRKWEPLAVDDDQSLVFELIRQDQHYPTLRHVRESLSRLRVYAGFSTQPRWALDNQERAQSSRNAIVVQPQGALDPRGRNLVNALYTLQQRDEHKWNYLLRQMAAEFPYCRRITFPPEPGGSKLALAWQDDRFSELRSAEQMSEGMWSFLLLLAALLPAEPAELIAFDEPDAHLHPSALRRLVSLLEEASSHSTVVFTSHSSRVLDELEEPARSLLVCEPTDDGTSILQLDPEQAKAWLDEYEGVGRLRDHGLLDKGNSLDTLSPLLLA